MANYKYCLLVWIFSNVVSQKTFENLQKRALGFLYKSYNTSYEDLLLKSVFLLMNIKYLRILCVVIFKILKSFNPGSMKKTLLESRQGFSKQDSRI